MKLALIIYLINLADNIAQVSYLSIIVFGMGTLFLILSWVTDEDEREALAVYIKKGLIITFIAILIAVLTPSTRTSYTMLAAYGGQAVLESDAVGRIAPKSIAVIEQFLDDKLEGKK